MTASLTPVRRRPLTTLLPTAAIVAATWLTAGCSSVDDAAARVNDTELSPDGFTELVDALSGGEVSNGDAIRNTLNIWVLAEVAGEQFAADDVALTAEELDAADEMLTAQLPGFADLDESTRETLANAQATFAAIDTLSDGQAFVELATSNADIYIDPRFGQFIDAQVGVLPLAIAPAAVTPPAAG